MKQNGIILKSKEFHFSELKKNDGIHVFALSLPIDFKHRAHLFELRRVNLDLIIDSVPSLNKWRPVMLFHLAVIVFELDDFLALIDWVFALLGGSFWPFLLPSWSSLDLFVNSFLLNVVLIKRILFEFVILVVFKWQIHFPVIVSPPHWSQKFKIYNKNSIE